ncbi:MAG: ORF6N domain-containing protein [Flavobacteriales bacterium]|nr:ORF6N domain-containing protein [Flavobacteriales bacterium]
MKPDLVKRRIYTIRDLQVLLDFDLAELYEVENRALKQAVRRNSERFPDDFMFQLTKAEWQELITICDNLPEGVKFSPTPPFAFTEQGVAMLSGVLRGLKAVQVNIAIMRAFVLMRQFALSHVELTRQLKELEQRYDRQFNDIFDAIGYLMEGEKREEQHYQRKSIGFKRNSEDPL